jgi:isopentenyl diphosphate isomerase/L-lactate dehydrogenase-like FMN-dependent dehydrogenase
MQLNPLTSSLIEGDFLDSLFDIKGIEQAAHHKLSEAIRAFFAGGAGNEITLRENLSAFDRIKLLPRVLRNVEQRSFQQRSSINK